MNAERLAALVAVMALVWAAEECIASGAPKVEAIEARCPELGNVTAAERDSAWEVWQLKLRADELEARDAAEAAADAAREAEADAIDAAAANAAAQAEVDALVSAVNGVFGLDMSAEDLAASDELEAIVMSGESAEATIIVGDAPQTNTEVRVNGRLLCTVHTHSTATVPRDALALLQAAGVQFSEV